MWRRRLRKWAKWACTVAAMLAVGVAVFSRFSMLGYGSVSNTGNTCWSVWAYHGQTFALSADHSGEPSGSTPTAWREGLSSGWWWGYSGEEGRIQAKAPGYAGLVFGASDKVWLVGVSLLYPVALTLIPAALLWYRDRRGTGRHACKKCGYDRRGLAADAKCPECGTVPG
jgi:hypothetical protein